MYNKHLAKAVGQVYDGIMDDAAPSPTIAPSKYSLLDLAKYKFNILNATKNLISGIGFGIDNNKLFISYDNPANIPKIKEALLRLNIPQDAYTLSYAKFTFGAGPPTPLPQYNLQ